MDSAFNSQVFAPTEKSRQSDKKFATSFLSHEDWKICNHILDFVLFADHNQPWTPFLNILSRDNSSLYSHSLNVSLMSLCLAVKLGLKGNDLIDICVGGLLHDLGMVLLPKSIRQKAPQNLTDFDLSLLHRHCQMGYDMIKNSQLSKACSSMILQHHERVDGSGYPNALKSNSISVAAKICMVADQLDEATSYCLNFSQMNAFNGSNSFVEIRQTLSAMESQQTKYPRDLLMLLKKIFGFQ